MTELEKLDAIRERLGVSFKEAKDALDHCEGDLTGALVYLEEQMDIHALETENDAEHEPLWDKAKTENFIQGIITQVKSFIQEGNVTKVRLISGEKTLIEIPATVGVVGVGLMLFSPLAFVIAAVGTATALVKEMVFEVEKSDGTIDRLNLNVRWLSGKDNQRNNGESGECCDCEDGADCNCDDEECCAKDEDKE